MNDVASIRVLRRRWKPHKERLIALGRDQSTLVRFHRACSWLARVEQMAEDEEPDLALVSQWIAFNSLYGQWDAARREPRPDRESWRAFTDSILQLDQDNRVIAALQEHKRLVMSLVDDEFLSGYFWQAPGSQRTGQAKKAKRDAQQWYLDARWRMVVDALLDRIYLMRCQVVHGAATYGGQLNRTSLRHCTLMLKHLITAFLLVWADHGADKNWGPMCYPPIRQSPRGAPTNGLRPKSAK
jgi:hypothetical protein